MTENNVQIISEDTAREMGDFTEQEIERAKTRADGYIVTMSGIKYFLSVQYNDLRIGGQGTRVKMPDQVGTGTNRLKPGGLRWDGK